MRFFFESLKDRQKYEKDVRNGCVEHEYIDEDGNILDESEITKTSDNYFCFKDCLEEGEIKIAVEAAFKKAERRLRRRKKSDRKIDKEPAEKKKVKRRRHHKSAGTTEEEPENEAEEECHGDEYMEEDHGAEEEGGVEQDIARNNEMINASKPAAEYMEVDEDDEKQSEDVAPKKRTHFFI